MPDLKTTTESGPIGAVHHHIVYVDVETGEGYISQGSGDSPQAALPHRVIFNPMQTEQRDASGNLLVAATPAYFSIEPASDGHSHEIIEYQLKDLFKPEEEEAVVKEMIDQFKTVMEAEKESILQGRESWDFYFGDQWKGKDRRKLHSEDRAALTINDIAKYVDEMSGYQRQQRTDLSFLPIEGGDQRVADLLNICSKTILDNCFFAREESKAFMNQIVPGRGFFNMYVTTERDIRGDIVVESFPFDAAGLSCHEKEDGSDAEVLFKHKMYTLTSLKRLFGDKADELQEDFNAYDMREPFHSDARDDAYNSPDSTKPIEYMPTYIAGERMVDPVRKVFRLIERHWKIFIPTFVVAYPQRDFYFTALGWDNSDINLIRSMGFLGVLDHTVTKIRITKICGNTLLSDEHPADLPVDDFFLIPIYGKKYGNKFRGKVEDAKDPQREVNYRHSQAVDITNKMVAYGWFYDSTTFPSPAEKKKFTKNSSRPGFTQELTSMSNKPEKVEGTKFPAEVVQLLQLSSSKIGELFNIQPEVGGANTSAEALLQRQKTKLTGNEIFFDNLTFAKQKMGRLFVAMLKRYYSPHRILRIVQSADQRNPVTIDNQPLSAYTEEEILSLLQADDLTSYDVSVGESGSSPTARMTTYLILKDMAAGGQQIPPELLLKFANIPEDVKQQALQSLQQSQQAQAQAADTASQGETNKTLIAHGIIPPKIQADLNQQAKDLGLPPPMMGPREATPPVPAANFGNDRSVPLAQTQ